MKEVNVLELFAGIGAIRSALTNLGVPARYEVVEIDSKQLNSYNAIYDENNETKSVVDYKPIMKPDLIFHGSPCQDFSIAGKGAGGIEGSGTRSSLLWETVKIVKETMPKWVVWENVPGARFKKHKDTVEGYIKSLDDLGYKTYEKILNSKDFGSPQSRRRIFAVSILEGEEGEFNFEGKNKSIVNIEWKDEELKEKEKVVLKGEKTVYEGKRCWNFNPQTKDGKPYNGQFTRVWRSKDSFGTIPAGGPLRIQVNETGKDYTYRNMHSSEAWQAQGFSLEQWKKAAEVQNYNEMTLGLNAGNSISVNVLEGIFSELFDIK